MSMDRSRWRRVKFGDVVRLNTDRCTNSAAAGIERFVGLEHIDPSDLRIHRWGLVEEGTTFTNHFRPGHVLFGKRRAYQRKVAVADFEGICSSDIYVFEPRDNQLLPDLLPYFCQTEPFYEHAIGTSAGSLSPRTNWSQLATFEFSLPPIEQQKQIADLLAVNQAVLEECSFAASTLHQLRSSYLQTVFEETAYPRHDSDTLQSTCVFVGDGTHLPPKFTDAGIPFLLVSNISSGMLDTNFTKWISSESYVDLTRSFRPRMGDILYSLVGSYGVPLFVDWDWPFSFQRHIGVIRTKESILRGK